MSSILWEHLVNAANKSELAEFRFFSLVVRSRSLSLHAEHLKFTFDVHDRLIFPKIKKKDEKIFFLLKMNHSTEEAETL